MWYLIEEKRLGNHNGTDRELLTAAQADKTDPPCIFV